MVVVGRSYIVDTQGVLGAVGATGPTGAAGAAGAAGPAGTTGYRGVSGAGLIAPYATTGGVTAAVIQDSIWFYLEDGSTLGASGFRGPDSSDELDDGAIVIKNSVIGSTHGQIFRQYVGLTGAEFRGIELLGPDIEFVGSTDQTILLRGKDYTHPKVGNTGELLFIFKQTSSGSSAHGAANTLWTWDTKGICGGKLQAAISSNRESLEGNENVIRGTVSGTTHVYPVASTAGETGSSVPFVRFKAREGEGASDGVPEYDSGFTAGIHLGLSADNSSVILDFSQTSNYNLEFTEDSIGSCCYCSGSNDGEEKDCVDYVSEGYCDSVFGTFSLDSCQNRSEGPYCQNQGGCCLYGSCFSSSESKCDYVGGIFINLPCGSFSCPDECEQPKACCSDGFCTNLTVSECALIGGQHNSYTTCEQTPGLCCEQLTGACCDPSYSYDEGDPDGGCTEVSAEECKDQGGIFYGVNLRCSEINCCGSTETNDRDPGACCHRDGDNDSLTCIDNITLEICSQEYGGSFSPNERCATSDPPGIIECIEYEGLECQHCPGNMWSGGDSQTDTASPRYKPGQFYEELGGYFIGLVGETTKTPLFDIDYPNETQWCLLYEERDLYRTIGLAAGSQAKINAFGQIKKQIEKHSRDTIKFFPGQEWYDEDMDKDLILRDDIPAEYGFPREYNWGAFSKEGDWGRNSIKAGWSPFENHLTPNKVYTYSLTNHAFGASEITPNKVTSMDAFGNDGWGDITESSSGYFNYPLEYSHECVSGNSSNTPIAYADDVSSFNSNPDPVYETTDPIQRSAFGRNQFLHNVWLPNLYSCSTNGELYQKGTGSYEYAEWNPAAARGSTNTPDDQYPYVYSRSSHFQSSFGYRGDDVINPYPSHMLISAHTDGWKGHPIVPEQPFEHFSEKIYGHGGGSETTIDRVWALVMAPTDLIPDAEVSEGMSWGPYLNPMIDAAGNHDARVVETTEFDGLLNTRMYDQHSIDNNVWFVEGGFDANGGNSDPDAYARMKLYFQEAGLEVEEETINNDSNAFRDAYEIAWNYHETNSAVKHISDLNGVELGVINNITNSFYPEVVTNQTDWYIPSLSELNYIYWVYNNTNMQNLINGNSSSGHTNMDQIRYWTSTSASSWLMQTDYNNGKITEETMQACAEDRGGVWNTDNPCITYDRNVVFGSTIGLNTEQSVYNNLWAQLVDNNDGLNPSTGWIDTDEIRRASGNALHMAYQVFNLNDEANVETIDPMDTTGATDRTNFDYPKPASSQDHQQYYKIAKGSVGTLARNFPGAGLRPVRRVPIYRANFDRWKNDYYPKPNVSRLEWKTDALKWPDKYGMDPDMNSDCPLCQDNAQAGCNTGPIDPSPFGACCGSRGNDANGNPLSGCHIAQDHNCNGCFYPGLSCNEISEEDCDNCGTCCTGNGFCFEGVAKNECLTSATNDFDDPGDIVWDSFYGGDPPLYGINWGNRWHKGNHSCYYFAPWHTDPPPNGKGCPAKINLNPNSECYYPPVNWSLSQDNPCKGGGCFGRSGPNSGGWEWDEPWPIDRSRCAPNVQSSSVQWYSIMVHGPENWGDIENYWYTDPPEGADSWWEDMWTIAYKDFVGEWPNWIPNFPPYIQMFNWSLYNISANCSGYYPGVGPGDLPPDFDHEFWVNKIQYDQITGQGNWFCRDVFGGDDYEWEGCPENTCCIPGLGCMTADDMAEIDDHLRNSGNALYERMLDSLPEEINLSTCYLFDPGIQPPIAGTPNINMQISLCDSKCCCTKKTNDSTGNESYESRMVINSQGEFLCGLPKDSVTDGTQPPENPIEAGVPGWGGTIIEGGCTTTIWNENSDWWEVVPSCGCRFDNDRCGCCVPRYEWKQNSEGEWSYVVAGSQCITPDDGTYCSTDGSWWWKDDPCGKCEREYPCGDTYSVCGCNCDCSITCEWDLDTGPPLP